MKEWSIFPVPVPSTVFRKFFLTATMIQNNTRFVLPVLVVIAAIVCIGPPESTAQDPSRKDVLNKLEQSEKTIKTLQYVTPKNIADFLNDILENDRFEVREHTPIKHMRLYLRANHSPNELVTFLDENVLDIDWEKDRFLLHEPDGDDEENNNSGIMGGSFGDPPETENTFNLWKTLESTTINATFDNAKIEELLNRINSKMDRKRFLVSDKLNGERNRLTLNLGKTNAGALLKHLRRTRCLFYRWDRNEKHWIVEKLETAGPVKNLEEKTGETWSSRIASGLLSGLKMNRETYLVRLSGAPNLRWSRNAIAAHIQDRVNPSIWSESKNRITSYRSTFIYFRCDDPSTRRETLRYLRDLQLSLVSTEFQQKEDWTHFRNAVENARSGHHEKSESTAEQIAHVNLRLMTEKFCGLMKNLRLDLENNRMDNLFDHYDAFRSCSLSSVSLPGLHEVVKNLEQDIKTRKEVQSALKTHLENLKSRDFEKRKTSLALLQKAGRLVRPVLDSWDPDGNTEAENRAKQLKEGMKPMPPAPASSDSGIVLKED